MKGTEPIPHIPLSGKLPLRRQCDGGGGGRAHAQQHSDRRPKSNRQATRDLQKVT